MRGDREEGIVYTNPGCFMIINSSRESPATSEGPKFCDRQWGGGWGGASFLTNHLRRGAVTLIIPALVSFICLEKLMTDLITFD